ncbi:MAG TPA: PAS domain S-box protein [Candidatus Sulfopaludibacter sp.]|jgi:PAS domain S-box-containing protein|nr:PAS domain S-box protein [Candidatus Sulfopaludibacter sp.]
MGTLRDLPIKQKLLVIILLTTGTALLLAGLGLIVADSLLFRARMETDLRALASIVSDNSTAALAFDDPRIARETLGALKARPHMVAACIFLNDGTQFAQYIRTGSDAACPGPKAFEEVKFGIDAVRVSHPILLDYRRMGTLVMLYESNEFKERIAIYGAIVLGILMVASIFAVVLSSGMRDMIAGPTTRLAQAAAAISQTGDYSVRVTKDSQDELGLLVDAFNQMVNRVQERDAAVQNARTSLETTLTSIGDAVISTDTEGRVVFANPVARKLLQWPDAELAGRPIANVFRIVNEFTREKVENPIEKVLREGAIAGLANHTVLLGHDGKEIPIDDSAAPILQNGKIVGVVLVFRDITDRRRAQQDAAYLAAIVESSDDAIVGKTTDGTIQTWNAGAERLYGYKAEEVIGLPMRSLLPLDRQHEESEILESLRAGSPVIRFESVRVRKDGTTVDVALTISPIRDRMGAFMGVSHVAHDISEQKRTAEQMRQTQKLESLGVLAGGIAHDFNNLLTGILGNSSLALDDLPASSPAREAIQAVIDAGDRAALLARQMLAYSGKGHFVLEHVDLSARIRETLPLIRSSIPPTVELQLKLDNGLPAVEADAAQMQQLMMNIIINAAEAVPEGRPGTVTITTRCELVDGHLRLEQVGGVADLRPGPYVVLEVADTGCGMDEETKARIFDPFFTTKFTGRGLGLAAVLGIVRGHRGSIEIASTPGAGTVFRILLPAAAESRELKPAAKPPEVKAVGGRGLVLVVDDEQIVRSMARQILERNGYTVLVAEDGARGVELFRREAADLRCVVLDLTMPVMGGEEALDLMKAVRADVPIILSSGFNELQAVRRFQGKGLAGFLQKPYRAGVLVEAVTRLVTNPQSRGAGVPE